MGWEVVGSGFFRHGTNTVLNSDLKEKGVDFVVKTSFDFGILMYPDKCWVGLDLMGVTYQECSSDRFFSLYFVWFNSLLSHIKVCVYGFCSVVRLSICFSYSDFSICFKAESRKF